MAGLGMASLAMDNKHDGLGDTGFNDKEMTTGSTDSAPQYSGDYIRPQQRKTHDKNVTFEEYAYYAKRTRAEEDSIQGGESTGILQILFPTKSGHGASGANEKDGVVGNVSSQERRAQISDEEWTNVSDEEVVLLVVANSYTRLREH
jgi:hypothetical protein